MPTLSFILSALLVSSGAMYSYLSSTDKMEQTKQKIKESDKIVYLSKKATMQLSTVKNSDTNQSTSVMSLSDTRLSTFVAKDDNINEDDTEKLDRLQKAMIKVVTDTGNNNPTCQTLANTGFITSDECTDLKTKQFSFYEQGADGLEIPDDSIIAKESLLNNRLIEKINITKQNEKIVKRKIQKRKQNIKDTNKLVDLILASNDQNLTQQLISRHLKGKDKNELADVIVNAYVKSMEDSDLNVTLGEIANYETQDTSIQRILKKNIEDLENDISNLNTELDTLEGVISTLTTEIEDLSGTWISRTKNARIIKSKQTELAAKENLKELSLQQLASKESALAEKQQKLADLDSNNE